MRSGLGIVIFVVVTALVLTLFAWINRSIFDRPAPPRPSPAVQSWDAGKLEAMEGRTRAEAYRRGSAEAGTAAVIRAGKQWSYEELWEGRTRAEAYRQP
jgi:hypothetical protein